MNINLIERSIVGQIERVKFVPIMNNIAYVILGYVFAYHLFRIFSFSNSVNEGLADAFIMYEQWLVHSGLVLAVLATYKRNVSNIIIIISLLIGHFLNEYYVLTHYLHYFLQDNMLYPYFVYSPLGTVNVQYGVILPYSIYLLVLFSMILFKRTRSIVRTYALIVSSVMWATTLIFHLIFVQWSLMDSISITQDGRKELAESIVLFDDGSSIDKSCETYDFLCFTASSAETFMISDFGVFEGQIEREVNSLHTSAFYNSEDTLSSKKYKMNLLSKEVSGNQFTFYNDGENSYLLIDKLDYNPFVWLHKILFGFFVGLAHLVWLSGAYMFLNHHQTKYKRLAVT